MSTFQKTRAAAAALSKDRKALATALAEEIPSVTRGGAADREALVQTELKKAAELLAEDGHDFAVRTLEEYRLTALWISGGNPGTSRDWTDGSYSLHAEACRIGMTKRAFLAWYAKVENPTVDALRKKHGKAQTNTGKLAETAVEPTFMGVQKAIRELGAEGREALVHSLVEDGTLGEAVKDDPVLRDEILSRAWEVGGAPDPEESVRKTLNERPGKGTTEVRQFVDRARYEMNRATEMLVKMHLHSRVELDQDDMFGLLRSAATDLGRAIFEFEGALGEQLITDRVEELRSSDAAHDSTDPREVGR